MKLESTIQKKILKYLRSKCYVTKIISASRTGVPDLLCCYNGVFYAFELKRDELSEASKLQKHNIDKIKENGGNAYVVWSLEQVKEIIK